MFFEIGVPKRLDNLGVTLPPIKVLKSKYEIAVLDDEVFLPAKALLRNGFRIVELGGDIKSIDQIAIYSIVVCDIKGVGKALGSKYEGAHVISEIRKSYPDKYLMAYSGSTFDPTYNDRLTIADKVALKDSTIDSWTQYLEDGLKSVGDPKTRWIRLRSSLLAAGMDIHDVFNLEQAFIKSIKTRDSAYLAHKAENLLISKTAKDLIMKFAATALIKFFESQVSG